ncbi:MAG: hypothetical protein ACOCYZ_03970 [Halococcoides sp.]
MSAAVTRPKVVVALMLVALASGAVFASVTLQDTTNPDKLHAAQGTLNDTDNLTVTDMNISYTGFTADTLDVVVENTDDQTHTANVSVEVKNGSDGVADDKVSDVELTGGDTTTVSVTIDEPVFDFDIIDVLVRELS